MISDLQSLLSRRRKIDSLALQSCELAEAETVTIFPVMGVVDFERRAVAG